LEYSNDSTALLNIPAPAWASQSANGLLNVPEAGSGSSPSSDGVQRFTLRSPAEKASETARSRRAFSILLIEDNPADAGLVREALEEHGVEGQLVIIADGDKAVNYVQLIDRERQGCPDLVIIDLNLPKRPGREVLQAMRQSAQCKDAVIVILSSSDAQQDRAESMGLGASRYIRKPIRLQEFLSLGATFKSMLEAR
jgi:CheY-like chemotaxis protein